jgi:metal-dependent amidase/aminoacylase/carboxypeptidase family protein
MAASTRFNAVVRGQGGHAGEPHLARDPVIAAAAIVQVMPLLLAQSESWHPHMQCSMIAVPSDCACYAL